MVMSMAGRGSVISQGDDDNHRMMARYILRECATLGWVESPEPSSERNPKTGVAILRSDGTYAYEPSHLNTSLQLAIERLQVNVAIVISSEITNALFAKLPPSQTWLESPSYTISIPILDSFNDVGYNREIESRSPLAYLLRNDKLLLVTSAGVENILNNGRTVEAMVLEIIWDGEVPTFMTASPRFSKASSYMERPSSMMTPLTPGMIDEKHEVYQRAMRFEEGYEAETDEELGDLPPRILPLTHMAIVGIAVMLVVIVFGLSVSTLVHEYAWDGVKLRFILAGAPALFPFMFFSLFLMVVISSSLFQLIMPVAVVLQNTKFHSAVKPNPKRHQDYTLPHITIQMPVYKEGLKGVIVPTIVSLLAAIRDYEARGGTASIYVNDDGMQAVEPDLAEARKHYYQTHGIGYCARPPNKQNPPKRRFWQKKTEYVDASRISAAQALANEIGFVRKGKFKKASNMNYCLDFSCRVEDELKRITTEYVALKGCAEEDLTVEDDDELYQQALENIIAADGGRTVAGGNVRIGELILIIDCDTRVPEDCLVMGALEMHESPEVAILQHASGVMQVVHNVFENGITFFTNLVYTAIRFAVGTGDVGCFVGHNAFLRWKALQSVAFTDPTDSLTKYWSDAHVSEDFDLALRLQMAGNVIRLATYHDGDFKEGVSLTVFDEISRWEKYAYGCNELVFHPIHKWIYKGPITKLFLKFIFSNMPVTSKFTIVAYIGTYYAIAAGTPLAAINYFVFGFWGDSVDHFYLPSWKVFVALLLIFNGVSNVALALLRHRIREKQFLPSLIEIYKWLPFMFLFFGGISLHLCRVLLCHMFGINVEWASTAKELGPTGFYIQLDRIISSFKWVFAIVIAMGATMIYLAHYAPWGYDITAWTILVPLCVQIGCHLMLPIALGLV